MCVYLFICICICVCVYIYTHTYTYINRERERVVINISVSMSMSGISISISISNIGIIYIILLWLLLLSHTLGVGDGRAPESDRETPDHKIRATSELSALYCNHHQTFEKTGEPSGTKRATSANLQLLRLQSSSEGNFTSREIEPARRSFRRSGSGTFGAFWHHQTFENTGEQEDSSLWNMWCPLILWCESGACAVRRFLVMLKCHKSFKFSQKLTVGNCGTFVMTSPTSGGWKCRVPSQVCHGRGQCQHA